MWDSPDRTGIPTKRPSGTPASSLWGRAGKPAEPYIQPPSDDRPPLQRGLHAPLYSEGPGKDRECSVLPARRWW